MKPLACDGIHQVGLALFRGAIGNFILSARPGSPGLLSLETV
ncbi:MAG: hypothetical protein ABIP11_03490 [Luteimonas sp.]